MPHWLKYYRCLILPVLLILILGCMTRSADAEYCPFCSATSLTLAEQMDSNDVVIIATLLEIPPPSDDPDAGFPKALFEIERVLHGQQFVAKEMQFRTQLVGRHPKGQHFLIMGVNPPRLAWSSPVKINKTVIEYLGKIATLPEKGPERLLFFQKYFEHDEPMLAFDAYDEFARAPYEELIEIKDQMQREKLLEWLQDSDTSPNRRRLYFTMLGICGTDQDIPILEKLITSDDPKQRAGLDALVACYLNLRGPAGVDLVERVFLSNPDAEHSDALAVVSALRFHGTEVSVIPRDRIVQAVRHLLDRPKMADMIIADLARWEDWTVMERLVQMFKDADEDSRWLRVPVITYLRACPRPEAEGYIAELAKIDPQSVARADFFLSGFEDDEDEDEDESGIDEEVETPKPAESDTSHTVKKVPVTQFISTKTEQPESNSQTDPAQSETIKINPNENDAVYVSNTIARSSNPKAATEHVAQVLPETAPVAMTTAEMNLTRWIILIPLAGSLVIFLLLWSVMNGWFERLIF